VTIFFDIFISVIVVVKSGDGVVKFAAVSAKIFTVNVFLAYGICPIAKNFDSFVAK
jgi:hypothetical protein